ncbi:LysM peptidoglycan-binding domain-containing protein [Cystobacter ferrugineus]|uniref:LysM domain-containing protein n=1 Tax=Cystobacter ferrugineus TaxID=83449 RepID=A0A1L9BAT6_9BACT|nr:LysM domain-containing protein [Cystobacter ferrugineus]OJH39384.1 hypothetical protein BON30_17895 [Cystobacter ferrugineus]
MAGDPHNHSAADREAEVLELQRLLVEHGYMTQAQMDTGPGVLGRKTRAALSRVMDGQAPDPTVEAADAGSSPSSTPRPPTLTPRTYRVRLGDTLAKLAHEFGVPLESLAELNHIEDARLIWVGQVLTLPHVDASPALLSSSEASASPAKSGTRPSAATSASPAEKTPASPASGVTPPRVPARSASAPSASPGQDTYPWIGRIKPWSASLRDAPRKSATTLVDVPRGTEVVVMGAESGWLHVQVTLGAKTRTGYISRELLDHERAVSLSLREALVVLKRAETASRNKGAGGKPAATDVWVSTALEVVQATGKYMVDGRTYTVTFASNKDRIKINTIEDFILFVEEVERQYPAAKPKEIATEIRQIWFSDENWEMLSAGTGVASGGVAVDIESKPNPIALKFDMADLSPGAKDLASGKKNKRLATAMGSVDISHVLAGIDTRLNGFPSTSPEAYLEQRGHDGDNARLKYGILQTASGGDSRDFATWSGDIGQAYADFLVSRYVKKEKMTLATAAAARADEGAILGDLHGYIAVEVWDSIPETESPTGREDKVSNYLRDLYLLGVDKSKKGASYQRFFEKAAGRSSSELKNFTRERSLAFARPWFAKQAFAHRGYLSSEGWTANGILTNTMKEFDTTHAAHVKSGKADEQLDVLVDKLLKSLSGKLQ